MEVETLKKIIQTQKEDIEEELAKEQIVQRAGTNYITKFLEHSNIVAILGVRRCGKSIFSLLLSKILKEQTAYINFYDERLIGFKAGDFEKMLQALYELYGKIDIIILDEIQEVAGWELFVNRLRRTKKVIITGSNSKLLSGELATYLTGRHLDFTLYPFSFEEAFGFKPNFYSTKDIAHAKVKLDEYLEGSGFPEYRKFGKSIVRMIYDDIINKDCLKRHPIREKEAFRRLAHYLASNFSSEFSYSKLSNILEIKDVHTVSNYVSYLQETFLFIVLERYSPKLKEQIIAPKKVYLADHGISNFVSFNTAKNKGRIFENIVAVELLRRKSLAPDHEYYYFRNHQGKEVDFVVKEGNKVKQLIQVCYDLSDEEVLERELEGLAKAADELKCKYLLIITSDKEAKKKIDGKEIRYIPLWKWLLDK